MIQIYYMSAVFSVVPSEIYTNGLGQIKLNVNKTDNFLVKSLKKWASVCVFRKSDEKPALSV